MSTEKRAPARIHHFIADQLHDLAVRGTVVSVLAQESAYVVMLSLAERGITFLQLSPYDVSRSLRGDPNALAVIRAELADMVGPYRSAATPRAQDLRRISTPTPSPMPKWPTNAQP